MRPTDKTGKKIAAWKKRINKGIYHDKEISDAAKAAFRRSAYQARGEKDDEQGKAEQHDR